MSKVNKNRTSNPVAGTLCDNTFFLPSLKETGNITLNFLNSSVILEYGNEFIQNKQQALWLQ